MDKRKIIKILLVIVGLFIAMAIAEISIKSVGTVVQEFSQNKKTEKKQQEIYNSDKSVESRQVEKFVDDVYLALENKKYEVVYNLLNSTYKECVFENKLENFKSFVQERLFLSDNHNIVEVTKKSGKYQVLVGVTKEENYKTQICTVEVIDENTCNVMFDSFIKLIKTSDTNVSTDNFEYNLKYYYETSNLGIFVFKVTNNSAKDVNLGISDIYLETNGGKKYEGAASGSFSIQANKNSEIKIVYNKSQYSLNNLNFVETQNGKTKDVHIKLNEIFDVNTE